MLVNGTLTNSEVWYGLKPSEIQALENLDLSFFRNLFEVPHTVPSVSLLLETGSLSLGTIIKVRRLNFLHYLTKLKPTEMLHKFFLAQWNSPVKSDWTIEAKQNLEEFKITANLNEIEKMSKLTFKNLVKKKAKDYEFNRLMEIKIRKSKLKDIEYTKLETQEYLNLKTMNASQAKALFKFRVRMAPFGENYRGGVRI